MFHNEFLLLHVKVFCLHDCCTLIEMISVGVVLKRDLGLHFKQGFVDKDISKEMKSIIESTGAVECLHAQHSSHKSTCPHGP